MAYRLSRYKIDVFRHNSFIATDFAQIRNFMGTGHSEHYNRPIRWCVLEPKNYTDPTYLHNYYRIYGEALLKEDDPEDSTVFDQRIGALKIYTAFLFTRENITEINETNLRTEREFIKLKDDYLDSRGGKEMRDQRNRNRWR